MSRIRGKNTKPELLLRTALWKRGLRYRISTKIFGKPDLAFISDRVAVFVDGCFWHGCPQHGTTPKSNTSFWKNKIERNKLRDQAVTEELLADDWIVLRLWEHQIKEDVEDCADQIEGLLNDR